MLSALILTVKRLVRSWRLKYKFLHSGWEDEPGFPKAVIFVFQVSKGRKGLGSEEKAVQPGSVWLGKGEDCHKGLFCLKHPESGALGHKELGIGQF